jgi:hypothetical protein
VSLNSLSILSLCPIVNLDNRDSHSWTLVIPLNPRCPLRARELKAIGLELGLEGSDLTAEEKMRKEEKKEQKLKKGKQKDSLS